MKIGLNALLSIIEAIIQPGQRVLDVGCGLGFTGEYHAKKGFPYCGVAE